VSSLSKDSKLGDPMILRIAFLAENFESSHTFRAETLEPSGIVVICSSYDDIMRALLFSLIVFSPFFVRAQPAEEVVNKYVDAIGGERKWKTIKSIITKGEYDYGGIVFPFTTYAKRPNRYKFVVPFNGKYYAQGFDGKKGWKIDAFKNETKPTLLKGKLALAMANEADVELENPFIKYKAKGHRIKLEGTDTIENKPCYKISLLKKNGQTETYYFDKATYMLHLKISAAKNIELEGALLHTYFSTYKESDGLKMAFKQVCKIDDQTILTITVKEVMLNDEIEKNEFNPMGLN
jgi:hypothetical protein